MKRGSKSGCISWWKESMSVALPKKTSGVWKISKLVVNGGVFSWALFPLFNLSLRFRRSSLSSVCYLDTEPYYIRMDTWIRFVILNSYLWLWYRVQTMLLCYLSAPFWPDRALVWLSYSNLRIYYAMTRPSVRVESTALRFLVPFFECQCFDSAFTLLMNLTGREGNV